MEELQKKKREEEERKREEAKRLAEEEAARKKAVSKFFVNCYCFSDNETTVVRLILDFPIFEDMNLHKQDKHSWSNDNLCCAFFSVFGAIIVINAVLSKTEIFCTT